MSGVVCVSARARVPGFLVGQPLASFQPWCHRHMIGQHEYSLTPLQSFQLVKHDMEYVNRNLMSVRMYEGDNFSNILWTKLLLYMRRILYIPTQIGAVLRLNVVATLQRWNTINRKNKYMGGALPQSLFTKGLYKSYKYKYNDWLRIIRLIQYKDNI